MSFLECYSPYDEVSLYIHIPFCLTKCSYCAFYSTPINSIEKDILKLYFKRLITEIKATKNYFKKPFKTLYIGGGTPSLVECKDYLFLIFELVGSTQETTIEGNIQNFDEEYLNTLKRYVTRISVGVQSFDTERLLYLGRFKTKQSDVINFLNNSSDFEVNFDFILGGKCEKRNDIETLFNLCEKEKVNPPSHISLYLLSVEDNTYLKKKLQNNKLLCYYNSEEYIMDELLSCYKTLEKHGFNHYEVSAFTKNKKCLHNLTYWRLQNYIGLGASASSHSVKGWDITYNKSLTEYAKGEHFSDYTVEKLTKSDIATELFLTHLRCTEPLTDEKFFQYTRLNLSDYINRATSDIKKFYNNGILQMSEKSLLFSDYYIKSII